MNSNFTCIDSFCGAGGLGLGLQLAGYKILLSFDNNPICIETQKLNKKYFFHEAINMDIKDALGGKLLKKANLEKGNLFLLAGGPPCQGFSIQRIGEDEDKRNSLIFKYIDLVKELNPCYFLMENVPGIAGKRGSKVLKQFTEMASNAGYWIHQKVLDAQDFGVPQRRKRIFIIGERKDSTLPFFRFPETKITLGNLVSVRSIIGNLPEPPEDGSDHPDIFQHRRDKLSPLNKKRLLALSAGQGRDQLPQELLAKCHLTSSSIIGHRNVYGRMAWDDVSPTITARFDSFTRGQFGHPEQLRSISLREGALLQTFPIDFQFTGTKVNIASQIGNAVPPLLAQKIGKQILKCHQLKINSEKN